MNHIKISVCVFIIFLLSYNVLATPPIQPVEICENIGEIRCSPSGVRIEECQNRTTREMPSEKIIEVKLWYGIEFCKSGYCDKNTITCKEYEMPKKILSNFIDKLFDLLKRFFSVL